MNDFGIYGGYIAMAMSMFTEYEENKKKFKEKILNEWDETKNMPRKMKKRVRKKLELEWAIANYDPFK